MTDTEKTLKRIEALLLHRGQAGPGAAERAGEVRIRDHERDDRSTGAGMDERGERWGCPESTDRGREGRDELAAYVFTTHKNTMVRSDDGDDGGTKGGRNRDSLGHDAER